MDPEKVKSIMSWPVPRSIHDVRMFLGLANFYRRFIKGFSKVALPITKLLRKESVSHFRWTTEAQAAFDELRTAFTTAPILQHFNPDLPTILEADASDFALGAVVSQVGEAGRGRQPDVPGTKDRNLAHVSHTSFTSRSRGSW